MLIDSPARQGDWSRKRKVHDTLRYMERKKRKPSVSHRYEATSVFTAAIKSQLSVQVETLHTQTHAFNCIRGESTDQTTANSVATTPPPESGERQRLHYCYDEDHVVRNATWAAAMLRSCSDCHWVQSMYVLPNATNFCFTRERREKIIASPTCNPFFASAMLCAWSPWMSLYQRSQSASLGTTWLWLSLRSNGVVQHGWRKRPAVFERKSGATQQQLCGPGSAHTIPTTIHKWDTVRDILRTKLHTTIFSPPPPQKKLPLSLRTTLRSGLVLSLVVYGEVGPGEPGTRVLWMSCRDPRVWSSLQGEPRPKRHPCCCVVGSRVACSWGHHGDVENEEIPTKKHNTNIFILLIFENFVFLIKKIWTFFSFFDFFDCFCHFFILYHF